MEAIVYIGHGSKSKERNQQFITFIKETMKRVECPIQEYCFLELSEPSIIATVEVCVKKGATKIIVIPVLLLAGVHVTEDIPAELEQAMQLYPGILFSYGSPLGVEEDIIDIFHERYLQKEHSSTNKKALLLVSHGSRNIEASIQFEELANRYRQSFPEHNIFTAYLKAGRPLFQEKLETITQKYEEIYILPHLLLSGGFTEKLKDIAKMQQERSQVKIIHGDPIGFDRRISNVLIKRIQGARSE